jgi:hypothetical protein
MKRLIFLAGLVLYFSTVPSAFAQQTSSTTTEHASSRALRVPIGDATGVGKGDLKVGPMTLKVEASLNHRRTNLQPTELAPVISTFISSSLKSPKPITVQPVVIPHGGTQLVIAGDPQTLSDVSLSRSDLSGPIPDLSSRLSALSKGLRIPQEIIDKATAFSLEALYDFTISLDVNIPAPLPVRPTTGHSSDVGGPYDSTDDFGVFEFQDTTVSAAGGSQLDLLEGLCVSVTLYRADGSSTALTKPEKQTSGPSAASPACEVLSNSLLNAPSATLTYSDAPIFLLQIDGKPNNDGKCSYVTPEFDFGRLFEETCQVQFLFAINQNYRNELLQPMELAGDAKTPILLIDPSLNLRDPKSTYVVNGDEKAISRGEQLIPSPAGTWTIDWQKKASGCRAVSGIDRDYANFVLKAQIPPSRQIENGIVVGTPKVFDVISLQKMLNTTAGQLAAISGFNANSINAAVGNFQGVTRTTSYLNAQVTTAPTPSINQQNTQSVNTPNTVQTTTPIGSTVVTLQCPDGSLPTIGSGTTLGGCAVAPVTGSTPNVPAYAPIGPGSSSSQGVLTTAPSGSAVTNTGSTANNQAQTTVATPSVTGVAPVALTANPLAPPTNIGVSSSDVLAEQVQLNSQITTLQLLLQGALSDQYLIKDSRAVGKRQQTTLGFSVALDPPPQFKHAVAEVRVIVIPTGRSDGPSIMNLLPSEKTYNVAKVTSNQKAFSGGAVIEAISVGVSTGKSRDRLYLAKDTDTLALQFPLPLRPGDREIVTTPLPQKLHDKFKSIFEFQPLGGCAWDKTYENAPEAIRQAKEEMESDVSAATARGSHPTAFGWQFRPVLGADYVRGGERNVFAQLALDAGLNDNYLPYVYIQTVWREYNPQTQVVGAVYEGSCSLTKEPAGGVNVLSQPKVRNVSVADLGGGQLKLSATGNFYSSSLGVLSSQNTLSTLFFDGSTLEAYGSALNLLESGDLKIVGQNGQNAPFAILTNSTRQNDLTCGIARATTHAVPRPDGNSRAFVDLDLGESYRLAEDGEPRPLVLINSQVYGLKESPFLKGQCTPEALPPQPAIPAKCHYEFVVPTVNLRNGQTFLVRDLAWDQLRFAGTVEFIPSFTAAKVLATPAAPSITSQPVSQEIVAGTVASFRVVASSKLPRPLAYQWARDGEAIVGANGPSYSLMATAADDGVRFSATVSNVAGVVTSNLATLTVDSAAVRPSVIKEPADQTAQTGYKATFSVVAKGTDPLTYQWRRGGAAIAGATSSSYTPPRVSTADDGATFSVVVSNSAGSASSRNATLTVTGTPTSIPAETPAADSKTNTAYEITGYDFRRIANSAACNRTFDGPCLNVYADSTPLDKSAFTVVSDNLATLQGVPASTKSLWFQIYWSPAPGPVPDPESTMIWELAIPKANDDSSPTVVGTPAFLYVGDTQTLSFSSPLFSAFATAASPIPITFNGSTTTGTYDSTKKVLKILITTAMTAVPGHKEMTVTVPAALGSGTPQPTTLTFDVVRQIIKE